MAALFPSNPNLNESLMQQCSEHLRRLAMAASESPSQPNSSPSSLITFKVNGLLDLHECVGQIFHLRLTQQAVEKSSEEKWVDDLLDGSLRLLDACTAAKDAILHTKECARELQSTIRRRRGGTDMEIEMEVRKYQTSRKVVRKAVQKALGNLKRHETRSSFSHKEDEIVVLVNLLQEVEAVTVNIFQSLLTFVSASTPSKGSSSWSLVSKLMNTKRVACTESQADFENEFTKVDSALEGFLKLETTNDLQKRLEKMESRIQDLEEGLEILFKRLIRNRVAILNILNH